MMLAGALLLGLLVSGDPDAVSESWLAGDLAAAGAHAQDVLEQDAAQEDLLSADGALLSFIAGLAARAQGEVGSAGYYFWAASLHERVCGPRLSAGARRVAEGYAGAPGGRISTDRYYMTSPYLHAPQGACRPARLPRLDEMPVEWGRGELAIAFVTIAQRDSGRLRSVTMIYDYPAGEVREAAESRGISTRRREQRFDQSMVLVLNPCASVADRWGGRVDLCRAGADNARD